jgi:hypothetical protein
VIKCSCYTNILAASAIICGVPGDTFHGSIIGDGVDKVEVLGVMLAYAPLPFPNNKNEYPQLFVKQTQGQFALWENAQMQKAS